MRQSLAVAYVANSAVGPVPGNAGYVTVTGFSLRETGGAAAIVVQIREGSATGTILAEIPLAASGSLTAFLPYVRCQGGVFFHTVSGTGVAEGAVYVQ